MIPGEIRLAQGDIVANVNRSIKSIAVVNNGDRPVQIGSHFHFYEVNAQLEFNRMEAFGYHLNIPAGTALRFEPGDKKTVDLVTFGGNQEAYGLNNKTNGSMKEGM
ncbi:urease subunit beta [Solibacillus ferritrahens]|uniref:urease subunit beta n=1 Tax=Solibacillus ferritrahens TaxID=3098620 RepID=UPI00300953CA